RGITGRLTSQQMGHEVRTASSRMLSAAAFGEIIILIVYLPILALAGVEGKMFKPMAQTVIFAILVAFVLSLTYVPVMASVFLGKNLYNTQAIADRMMDFNYERFVPMSTDLLSREYLVIIVFGAVSTTSDVSNVSFCGDVPPSLH